MAIDPTQQTPALPDTPAPSAPEGTPDPYEKRYNDLRPQYDRTAQEAADLRRWKESLETDPTAQQEFLKSLGYEVEEEEPDPYLQQDPNADLRRELAELKEWKDGLTAKQQQEQQLAAVEANVEEQFKALGETLTEHDRKLVEAAALYQLPARPDGMPDIEAAYGLLVERDKHAQQQWRDGKRRAPAPPANGTEGSNAPNLDDTQQRRAWMAQQLEHMQAQG